MNNNYHGKIKKLDLSKWIVTKFYHYTSGVNDPDYYEYDEAWHDKPLGDKYIKELYNHFLEIVDTYYRIHTGSEYASMRDNKTVIEIRNIETGELKYVSSKDGRYLFGNSVWSEYGYHTDFGVVSYYKN